MGNDNYGGYNNGYNNGGYNNGYNNGGYNNGYNNGGYNNGANGGYGNGGGNLPMGQPNNYLVWAILVTFLCCMPLGAVAIAYATKVDDLWEMGQYDLARRASDKAKTFLLWAVGAAVVVWICYFLFAATMMSSIMRSF